MGATFLPSVTPSYGSSLSVKPQVKEISFGDGYSERIELGMKRFKESLSLSWEGITVAEADEIRNFFENEAAGGAPFYWQSPDGVTKSYYYTEAFSYTYVSYNTRNFSITINETSEI